MRPPKLKKTSVIEALTARQGFVSIAATDLGVTRQALHQFIKKNQDVADLVDDFRYERIDSIEAVIYQLAQGGNLSACMFILRTQGRDRGWVEAKPVDTNRTTPSEEAQAILSDLLEQRCTAANAAIRFDTLGLPIPDSVRLLLGKETVEAPDPSDGQYAVISPEEMDARAKARLAEINGQKTGFLPQRQKEVAELKEDLSGSESFHPEQ